MRLASLFLVAVASPGCVPCLTERCSCVTLEMNWVDPVPDGVVGEEYPLDLVQSSIGTWRYAVTAQALPAGMELVVPDVEPGEGYNIPGLRGTPEEPGTFTFSLAADAVDCFAHEAHDFTWIVGESG